MIKLGKDPTGKIVKLDIEQLLETRMLMNATSGAGKSYAIRGILEQSYGKVQQIVFDLEGEFITLREKYDYLIAGADGDIPLEAKTATKLLEQVMESRISVILNMSEMKKEERKPFVRKFLERLMHLPKRFWEPLFVIIDEAHHFVPQAQVDESGPAVIDLITRGRKRSWCPILSTQRLAKVNKDACAELLNVFIGKTTLDVDQHRASEYLGISNRQERMGLRNLKQGEFFCFGEAVKGGERNDYGVALVKIGQVKTSHSMRQQRKAFEVPEPKGGLKKIVESLKSVIAEKTVEKKPDFTKKTLFAKVNEVAASALKLEIVELQKKHTANQLTERRQYQRLRRYCDELVKCAERSQRQLIEQFQSFTKLKNNLGAICSPKIEDVPILEKPIEAAEQVSIALSKTAGVPGSDTAPLLTVAVATSNGLSIQQQSLLNALGEYKSLGITPTTRIAIAARVGRSSRSGSFNNNVSRLSARGFITYPSKGFVELTEVGDREVANIHPPAHTLADYHQWFAKMVTNGQADILKVVIESYPETISREQIAEVVQRSANSGSFNNNVSRLSSLGLINYPARGFVKATELLFPKELV